jgi:hypothetical protein
MKKILILILFLITAVILLIKNKKTHTTLKDNNSSKEKVDEKEELEEDSSIIELIGPMEDVMEFRNIANFDLDKFLRHNNLLEPPIWIEDWTNVFVVVKDVYLPCGAYFVDKRVPSGTFRIADEVLDKIHKPITSYNTKVWRTPQPISTYIDKPPRNIYVEGHMLPHLLRGQGGLGVGFFYDVCVPNVEHAYEIGVTM